MSRIVIITNAPAPYRVAFFRYLMQGADKNKYHVIYASQNRDIGRHWEVTDEELGNHTFLDCRVITIKRRYDDKHIVLSTGVTKELKRLRPDLVICMEYNITVIQAVRYCLRHHIPYISWSDGTANSERAIGRMQHLFRKYVIGHAASYISSSTATMEHQISYGADPAKCHKSLLTVDIHKYLREKTARDSGADHIPAHVKAHSEQGTGVDTDQRDEATGASGCPFTLLYVGSLIGRKGVDLLLDAFALTSGDIRLILVGEGSEEAALRAQTERLGISERITFAGYKEGDELTAYYEQADAFVLPTREDCYGLVILEAMCASLPVIASKYADGAFDLIEDGVQGIIADPYDATSFASAIDTVFSDPDRLHAMQRASYERAFAFDFPVVAEGFYEAVEEAIKSSK